MMPSEKGFPVTDAHSVAVDHRKALTITPGGKLDTCQIGNPLKIHKRRRLFEECAHVDVGNSARKRPKIHWTELAASGTSPESPHPHNGRRADAHEKNDSLMLDIERRQVKVILIDVLQTAEGQRYLNSSWSDTNAKTQSPLKGGPRERWSERGPSTEYSRVKRTASVPLKDQTKLTNQQTNSPSSRTTDSVCSEENGKHLYKEVQSPAAKRFNNSLKPAVHSSSDEEESCSRKERDSSPNKESHNPLAEHTGSHVAAENESCPDEENTDKNKTEECAEVMSEKEGEIEQECEEEEEEEPLHRNGEVLDEVGGARGSVLRLSAGAAENQLADGEVTLKSSQMANSADKHILDSELVEVRQVSKLQTTEPIVLSSEEEEEEVEEEEDGGTLHIQALEGAKDLHRQQNPAQALERKMIPDVHIHPSDLNSQGSSFEVSPICDFPVMELKFSAFYMGSLSTLTDGSVKITDDRITISFKEHVCKYSVWDELLVQDSRLAKENEAPPPSVLLLWLDEVQAQRLSSDLSVLHPGTRPGECSTCIVLCVSESLSGVQGALLASIMDIVGLRHGNTELLSPLTHPDSLKILQNSRDSHMLQLLLPIPETHTVSCESGTVPAPASTTTASAKDSDALPDSRAYTLCQSRVQSTYSVSLVHKPAADWTPYRHCGPARRLIQFPPAPSKGAITVTTEDLECLDSGEFLNDVIIDFYLKYLLVQKAPHASVRRSHVFSSFFYKQLTRRDNANEDSTTTPTQLRRHQRVRTWTRHVDIFEKDFLFVPVNQEAHWYLVVVCFPGLDEPEYVKREGHASDDGNENSSDSTAQSESQHGDGDINSDENSSRSISAPGPPTCTENTCKRRTVCKRPCILIMDSLKLSVHERIFKLLREYLQAEWEVKRGGHRDFSAERMVGSHCRVPLQDNSSDCGLYLLQYAESFLQDPVVHFDLPLKLECWFPRQKVREKREEIRDLVLHLYRFQQGSLGNDCSDNGKEIGNIA